MYILLHSNNGTSIMQSAPLRETYFTVLLIHIMYILLHSNNGTSTHTNPLLCKALQCEIFKIVYPVLVCQNALFALLKCFNDSHILYI